MKSRLAKLYQEKIVAGMIEQFGYRNVMQVPKIMKITLNMGVGEATADRKFVNSAAEDLTKISGQKAVVTFSRKSVAGFKVREGWPIGCKVTLRSERMFDFLDRLISIVIPRIRDFRGLNPRSFDSRGNYNMGIKEQIVFPEIDYEKIDNLRGLDIAITTSARNDEEARSLLLAFGFPLKELK